MPKGGRRATHLVSNPPQPGKRPPVEPLFPVVAIGASAGGLEALELFLKHVPAQSGMAFVVVQHLDPTQKGMLVELLLRVSTIPVVQVTDRTRVKPDHVYVIPPNKDMSIVHGVLHLLVPIAPRGLRLPIDFFFRSLADDVRHRSIGVLLSGMGSDGTLGLRAIRERAGSVFVQSPESARFDAMPRNAIEAGVVDVVATVDQLPAKIVEYLQHAPHIARPEHEGPDTKAQSALEKIIGLLRTATGHDFTPYKSSTLYRRIERRMGLHQIGDIDHYVRYLRENPEEAQLLFRELLIGVTSFLRDPAAWEYLGHKALPGLLATCGKRAVLRAWVPACSTGEEAYSLGIVLREALDKVGSSRNVSFQIFATDLDSTAVDKARHGAYPASIAQEVSPERLKRFFVREDGAYRVRKEIRDRVIFATQNVLQDPPFTKLDLLTCRNLLIYLDTDVQRKLLPLFHYSLKPGGLLLLGSAETAAAFAGLFAALDGKSRLYRRLETAASTTIPIEFPSASYRMLGPATDAPAKSPDQVGGHLSSLQTQVEQILLQRFAPAAILVSHSGDILFVSGHTGKYLELPAGKTNWNVLAMAREGLRRGLEPALHKALLTKSTVMLAGVSVSTHRVTHTVDVTIEPIQEPAALRGTVLVVFSDVAARSEGELSKKGKGARRRTASPTGMEDELRQVREELRILREEGQTTQEELKSANEELQSTNEELQSTNEELTTSKEEMQSMNEELQTLNSELETKVDDLSRASNDMKNLLDSTAIAVVFLDEALRVRRFTPQAATLIKLLPADVGRPLADLVSDLEYPEIYDDAREVLETLVFKEKIVLARDGRCFNVRIMPYRTSDNRIDGVVITFIKNVVAGTS
jgi:two-component system CheB/CheR fusion protein